MLVLSLGFACGWKQTAFDDEIRSVQALTIPADACSVATFPSIRGTFSVSASWGFETSTPWPVYSRWVMAQLQPAFQLHSESPTRLEFIKHLPHDSHFVRLEPDPAKRGRIRVEFAAVPN